jgi:hypothetical protein
MKRPFNKQAYDACDSKAKLASISLMKNLGYEPVGDITEEHYKKFDLVFQNASGHQLRIENEVRPKFYAIKLTYPTIHIPLRKVNSQCDYYFFWHQKFNAVGILSMEDIRKHKDNIVPVLCQNEVGHKETEPYFEDFIDVPKELAQFFELSENNKWKKF